MTQITIDKSILLVEVPVDATDFFVHDLDEYMKIVFTSQIQDPLKCGGDMLRLPFGNWQFIGTTDAITEEIAEKIVTKYKVLPGYKDYEFKPITDEDDIMVAMTALESYQSWLRANKISTDKRFAILKLNP